MAADRGGKRKSPFKDDVSELNELDLCSIDEECSEPDAKVQKIDNNIVEVKAADSNLIVDKPNTNNSSVIDDIITIDDISACEEASEYPSIETITIPDTSDVLTETSKNEDDTVILLDDTDGIESNEPDQSNDVISIGEISDAEEVVEVPIIQPETESRTLLNLDANILSIAEEVVTSSEIDGAVTEPTLPNITIKFSDPVTVDLYKSKLVKFLQGFIELEVDQQDELSIRFNRDPLLNPSEWVILDDSFESIPHCDAELDSTPSKRARKKAKKSGKDKDLFVLDTSPSVDSQGIKYNSKFSIATGIPAGESDKPTPNTQSCFNCGASHSLKDCPEPKNFSKINAARDTFRNQTKPSRYHEDDEQKFDHLIAGRISDNLRDALGLRRNQIPPFTYYMRTLGYPPGWLEDAKIVHSNLVMFGVDEDKEASQKISGGLDPAKIIDYPGFNVPLEKGMKDEFRMFNSRPYCDEFSKKAMLDYFQKQFGRQQDNLEICNMDLDTNGKEEEPVEPLTLKTNLTVLQSEEAIVESPSLNDLEKQKLELLAQLNDSNSGNQPDQTLESSVSENTAELSLLAGSEPISTELSIDANNTTNCDESMQESECLSPSLNVSSNSVKISSFGTPILKSNSPYNRLPNQDNFSKDVSPMICFENLPNSTGKYEQMSGVLEKVRNTLKSFQNCDS